MEPVLQVRVARPEEWLEREWLVANGLGGYAFGTVGGVPTRGYHAPLVAAHPAPRGRVVAVQHLLESARVGADEVALSGFARTDGPAPWPDLERLESFALELGLPVWRWRVGQGVLEKRLAMVHGANACVLAYTWSGPGSLKLRVQPWFCPRGQNDALDIPAAQLDAANPPVRGGTWRDEAAQTWRVRRETEIARGYGGEGPVVARGAAELQLEAGQRNFLILGEHAGDPAQLFEAESQRRRELLARVPRGSAPAVAQLALAADAFIVRRPGDGLRTVVAGYPWFTDWGRDTFIALEGLALVTGRHDVAREILRAFAAHARDGLIPNFFPETAGEPVFNAADSTLWFFHALGRTGDHALVEELLPGLRAIIQRHLEGTRFGIGVDPRDGLLRQGAPGMQLTWMDAKAGDWVVTPRRGKAVEQNALWFQALRLMADWTSEDSFAREAARVQKSFNSRFWCAARGHLFDVVDGEHGDDVSLRPNQLFAISLPHPVLERARWRNVLEAVRGALLTPYGLRTLSPDDARYRGQHGGDVLARDAAYHQGTVWPWLLGAYADAQRALDPEATLDLEPLLRHLETAGVGYVSEVFGGDSPHAPEGCPAQAWSVAELLRILTTRA